jgi:Domain of unknown function (DUF4135)
MQNAMKPQKKLRIVQSGAIFVLLRFAGFAKNTSPHFSRCRCTSTLPPLPRNPETDASLLSAAFGIADIRLNSVTMGISDRHAGGYQVILADFNERKVLYKPKDMSS